MSKKSKSKTSRAAATSGQMTNLKKYFDLEAVLICLKCSLIVKNFKQTNQNSFLLIIMLPSKISRTTISPLKRDKQRNIFVFL